MLGEIHEYQIKGRDFVMLMCCYSKLGLDVLLIVWHLLRLRSAFSAEERQEARRASVFARQSSVQTGDKSFFFSFFLSRGSGAMG